MAHEKMFQEMIDARNELAKYLAERLDKLFPDVAARPHCVFLLAAAPDGEPMAVATETVGDRASMVEMLAYATLPEAGEKDPEKLAALAHAAIRHDAAESDCDYFLLIRRPDGQTVVKCNMPADKARRVLDVASLQIAVSDLPGSALSS